MKKIRASLLFLLFVLSFVSTVTVTENVSATCKSGIKNNGLGGIFIDLNSEPYTSFEPEYAYSGVVAWYTSARVKHLTGKGDVSRSGGIMQMHRGLVRDTLPRPLPLYAGEVVNLLFLRK